MQTIAVDPSSTNRHFPWFVFVTPVFATVLLAPNLVATKPVELFGLLCLAVTIFQFSTSGGR